MIDEEILNFCIRHRITVSQYFFMWLLVRKDWNLPRKDSLAVKYLNGCGKFEMADIQDLIERGFVDDFNSVGQTLPEMYMVSEDVASEFFTDETAGEELWNNYPATFPLSDGKMFVSRAGGNKDDLINAYLKRINRNPNKHRAVMVQLERYKQLVKLGKINGHKISDWIMSELWNTIEQIKDTEKPKFGRDI